MSPSKFYISVQFWDNKCCSFYSEMANISKFTNDAQMMHTFKQMTYITEDTQ